MKVNSTNTNMGPMKSQHQLANLGPHSQKLILILEKVTPQKRERGLHPRKKIRPATPRATAMHPPLQQAPP